MSGEKATLYHENLFISHKNIYFIKMKINKIKESTVRLQFASAI